MLRGESLGVYLLTEYWGAISCLHLLRFQDVWEAKLVCGVLVWVLYWYSSRVHVGCESGARP